MNPKTLYLIAFVIGFFSCEDKVDLDFPERDKRLVVEGLITNEDISYTIKLSNTSKYSFKYDTSKIDYEKGAIVIISDNTGISDTLNEFSPGMYQTHTGKIQGIIGRSYKIDIITQAGKHYGSKPEEMVEVPKIDSIYFDRDYKDKLQPYNSVRYNVYIDWQDPPDTANYYLESFSAFWNKTWYNNGIHVFDDMTFNGLYLKKHVLQSAYANTYFLFKLKRYSLTKSNRDFWNLVFQQLYPGGNGIVNSSVPLYGNIFNIDEPDDFALGYFQVSAVTTIQISINR